MCMTRVWRRQGVWEHVLGEHLARRLFGKAIHGESVEVAAVEVDFPWLTKHGGKVCFELGQPVLEVIAN